MSISITAENVQASLRTHLVQTRKLKRLTVAQLAQQSGVPYGTLRKFEQTGTISLSQFLKLLDALSLLTPLHELTQTHSTMGSFTELVNGDLTAPL